MHLAPSRHGYRALGVLLGWLWGLAAQAAALEVEVEGLSGELKANVLAFLSIYQERESQDLTPARIESLHRRAPAQIRRALEPFGFYQVQIQDRLLPPDAKGEGTWRASYQVELGEPVRIGQVDYRVTGPGATDPIFPKTLPLKVGDVLRHETYERIKAELEETARAHGYLDYRWDRHLVLIDLATQSALVELHLETGPQYRFGTVRFRQDLLDEGLLERYVRFKPGDLYDPGALLALQGRLLGSEYYSDVEIIPRKESIEADNRIPIEVIAKPNLANKYRLGVGFATDIGPRLTLDYQRRYLNRWGHRLRTELSLAPALSQWEFDYRIPIQDPTRDSLLMRPSSTYYDTAARQGWVHSLQIAHSTQDAAGWRRTLGLDYRFEDLTDQKGRETEVNDLAPNLFWSKTVADDPVKTHEGYRLRYGLIGSLEGVVSSASYLSAQLQFKWVRALIPNYRLIARTDLGATLAESLDEVPKSRRFYAGGDNSIRGWGFEALGPSDPNTGETLGGRYLAVGSLELERRLTGPWSLAVFTDFGNAFDPGYSQDIAYSLGAGVRWSTPIGPVRLDLAFALSKREEDRGLPPARLHLLIGPDL